MAKKAAKEAPPRKSKPTTGISIVLKRDAALGAGTLKKGTALGTVDLDGARLFDMETLQPAETLSPTEVTNLKLNQHLVEAR